MNTIYCYSTEIYLERGWIKVGQTNPDREAPERIKEQNTTSNPERHIPLFVTETEYTDHEVRAQLKRMGFE